MTSRKTFRLTTPAPKAMYFPNMALSRRDFKNKVTETMIGALGEYYKARLAEVNNLSTRDVEHWDKEVATHIHLLFPRILFTPVHGLKKYRLALSEAYDEAKTKDRALRQWAAYIVKKDFGLKSLRHEITDKMTEDFWHSVYAIAEAALTEQGL